MTSIRAGALCVSILILACRGESRSSEAERPAPSAARPADAAPATPPAAPVGMSCQVGGPVQAVVPGRDGVDCFVLREGAPDDAFKAAIESSDDPDGDPVALCPQVYALRGGKPTHLKADGGPLTRTSDCCNLTRLAAAGPDRLVVRGEGMDCFGGRAEAELEATYAVTTDGLRLLGAE